MVFPSLAMRLNARDGVSNYRRLDCLLNRRPSKKISKLRVTGPFRKIHRWPVDSRHKGPVTREIFPVDDVILWISVSATTYFANAKLRHQVSFWQIGLKNIFNWFYIDWGGGGGGGASIIQTTRNTDILIVVHV